MADARRLGRWASRPLVLAFSALWAVTLVPIWANRLLPLLDLPAHLAGIAIWHRYSRPAWGYSRYYDLNILPIPYFGHYFPVHVLSYLCSIETANKIYLSLYALMLPLGVALLAKRLGRSPWLSLFVFPLVYNAIFSLGFITCCAAMALMLFALLALDLFLEKPTPWRGAAVSLLAILLYLEHLFPWMFFGLAAAGFLVVAGVRKPRTWLAGALLLPSVGLALLGFAWARNGTTQAQPGPFHYTADYEDVASLFNGLPKRILISWGGLDVYWMVLALGGIWLLLLLTSRPAARRDWRPALLFGLAVVAYLWLPWRLRAPIEVWNVGARFAPLAALFAFLLPEGEIAGWRRLILIPAIFLSVHYSLELNRRWADFNTRAEGMAVVMENVPRGSTTLTVIGRYHDAALDPDEMPYLHFSSYAALWKGGFDPNGLIMGFPMRIKNGLPTPNPGYFDFNHDAKPYDYVVTSGEAKPFDRLGAGVAARLITQAGDWKLYRVLH